MTNPNILRRSNPDAIRKRVLSGSGNMESTSIKKSDSISGGIVSQIQFFLKMWELWSKPLCCIILVTTKI